MKRFELTLLRTVPILALGCMAVGWFDLIPLNAAGDVTIFGKIFIFVAAVLILSVPICFLGYWLAAPFSRTVNEQIKAHKWLDVLWVITTLLFFLFLTSNGHPNPHSRRMRTTKTYNELVQVSTAIAAYEIEYGSLPSKTGNRDLLAILQGKNERKIEFINLRQSDFNLQGEAVDGWGTPIRFSLLSSNHPAVQSAGADRVWDTPDDLACEIP